MPTTTPPISQDLLNHLADRDRQHHRLVYDTWQAMTGREQAEFTTAATLGFTFGRGAARTGGLRAPRDSHIVATVRAADIATSRPTGPVGRRANALYREAAIMGWVQGIDEARWPRRNADDWTDKEITGMVLSACLGSAVADLYPVVNHLQLNNQQLARRRK